MRNQKHIDISTGCKVAGTKRWGALAPLLVAVGLAIGACTPSFGVARTGFTSDYAAAGSGFHQQIPMHGEAATGVANPYDLPAPWGNVLQVATIVGVSALLTLPGTAESCR